MMHALAPIMSTLLAQADHVDDAHAPAEAAAHAGEALHITLQQGNPILLWLLILPLLGACICGIYRALGIRSKLPAWTSVALLGTCFLLAIKAYADVQVAGTTLSVTWFEWIGISWGQAEGQSLIANIGLWIDPLTSLWMLFVTGLATLIALYASEYMEHDTHNGHYSRFFAAFNLFVFAMTCLVMGDSLVLLFLGWEGVGLCSYLLIGYFYTKPSAVAAAKKAFIMNRIGDFGLVVAMMLTFVHFGSLEYATIFEKLGQMQADVQAGGHLPWEVQAIPFLLALGAFGKSAQLPLFVWLPDAMEGPTPVSALIHAATMVTAGVYLIARMLPVFALTPESLTLVAWVGGLTALVSATIGMAVFDIKRVMAYSTVSQLGYMFLGLGVLSQVGAAYHVFTHAFFKATLFLSCGAVMHGMAGQLDLRKLSGLLKVPGWKIVGYSLLIGCLCLAGFPLTSGFFSKDQIIAEAFVTQGPGFELLGWIALLTAGMTAYYSFRVFFRVFMGPVEFHPGDDHHGDDHGDDHEFHPHAPKLAINLVLVVLAIGSLAAAIPYFLDKDHHGWVGGLVHDSTSGSVVMPHDPSVVPASMQGDHHANFYGLGDPHKVMYFVSGLIGLIGIGLAYWFHLHGRTEAATSKADALKAKLGGIGKAAENKWYVDEIYNFTIRVPLYVLAHIFALIDKLIVDGLVNLFGWLPSLFGRSIRPLQHGYLQGYASGMAVGLVLLLLLLGGPTLWDAIQSSLDSILASAGGGH
ncbi:MAG: NADH-quinone oxidoreductase subunit L [Planctomycetota bacterium]|jgi:NADH-quinone oxidoreductase subunit L